MFKKSNYFKGLSRNSFLLAFASFFADVSTEMLYPILPIYLTQNLKAGGSIVGLVEGIAEATQNIVQGISGYISDKLQRRKPVAFFGYLLAAVSKSLIGAGTAWQWVLGARFFDRLGTGTRSAPRDALIAGSADEKHRGKAFGLEGFGDNLGAFIGPLIAVVLIFIIKIDLRSIFFLSLIPGLAAASMILMIKEKDFSIKSKSKLDLSFKKFPRSYWKYLFVIVLFGLGNSSNSFLILQIKNIGTSLLATILLYAFYNLIASLVSYPLGSLSDKIGRKNILAVALIIFFLVYLGFSLTRNIFVIFGLFILYGSYQGIFRSVGKAFVSDFVPQELRASAIGLYSAAFGLSTLFASIAGGILWDQVSHQATFLYGAFFSLIGIFSLAFLI